MANTFKVVTKAGVTSADVIYTVAGSTTTVVLGLVLGNTTTSQVTATVTLVSNTGSRAGNNDEANQDVELVTNAPIPAGSSVELLKKPKVLSASQTVELQCSANSALQATVSAERQENTDLNYFALESTSADTFQNGDTMQAATVFESILCTNDDGTNDVKVTVVWANGSNTVQAYLSYDLVIPAGASVELLESPLAMPSGHKLRASANQANRCEIISAFKYAS